MGNCWKNKNPPSSGKEVLGFSCLRSFSLCGRRRDHESISSSLFLNSCCIAQSGVSVGVPATFLHRSALCRGLLDCQEHCNTCSSCTCILKCSTCVSLSCAHPHQAFCWRALVALCISSCGF